MVSEVLQVGYVSLAILNVSLMRVHLCTCPARFYYTTTGIQSGNETTKNTNASTSAENGSAMAGPPGPVPASMAIVYQARPILSLAGSCYHQSILAVHCKLRHIQILQIHFVYKQILSCSALLALGTMTIEPVYYFRFLSLVLTTLHRPNISNLVLPKVNRPKSVFLPTEVNSS